MTSQSEIGAWFDDGVNMKATHMLVVCDTFDYDEYPVFAMDAAACIANYKNSGEMQRVMEVYDLSLDKEKQMREHRAMHLPNEK